MKKLFLTILLVLMTVLEAPGKTIPLPQLTNPGEIAVAKNHIYVIDFPTVYIYSLKDFSLVKKIGRSGEGPREFLRYIKLSIQPDYMMVQSLGKVSFFTLDANFLKEFKSPFAFRVAKAVGERLVIGKSSTDVKSGTSILTVNLCNHDFSDLKEISRAKHFYQDGKVNVVYLGRINLFRRRTPLFYTSKDKIIIEDDNGETGAIQIFDKNGKKLSTITHEYEQLKLTQKHKKEIVDFFILIKSPAYRLLNDRKWLTYPEYFPRIRIFHVADNKIYVVPYKKKQGKSELHVFDITGKLVNTAPVDLVEQNIFEFCPYAISGGQIYQIIDNEDTGDWELQIHEIPYRDLSRGDNNEN